MSKRHHTKPVSKGEMAVRREIKVIQDSFDKGFNRHKPMNESNIRLAFPNVGIYILRRMGLRN